MGFGFAPTFDYPLPWHWSGYTLQTRYTYQLPLNPSKEALLASLDPSIRQYIRKQGDNTGEFRTEKTVGPLLNLIRKNIASGRQIITPNELNILEKLADWLLEDGYGQILTYRPEGKPPVAGVMLVHFAGTSVNLMSVLHPDQKAFGIMSLLMWQAILEAKSRSRIFDFEGSMIEGIEKFFRGFSPRPVPYLYIHKNKLPLLLRWFKKL